MTRIPSNKEIRKAKDTLKQILDSDGVEDLFLYTERLAMAKAIEALTAYQRSGAWLSRDFEK